MFFHFRPILNTVGPLGYIIRLYLWNVNLQTPWGLLVVNTDSKTQRLMVALDSPTHTKVQVGYFLAVRPLHRLFHLVMMRQRDGMSSSTLSALPDERLEV